MCGTSLHRQVRWFVTKALETTGNTQGKRSQWQCPAPWGLVQHMCCTHKAELSATQRTASCFIQRYSRRERCVPKEKWGGGKGEGGGYN